MHFLKLILEIFVLTVFIILCFWIVYNLPYFIAGLMAYSSKSEPKPFKSIFKFSILIAAKNEEKVIERLLKKLTELNYPKDKYEVIIVEDGSTDQTLKLCENYARKWPYMFKLYHRDLSNGKPSALNFALSKVNSDIVVILDADNIPEANILHYAASYFSNPQIAAIQGKTNSINFDQNIISRLSAYEERLFQIYIHGKDYMNAFVPLTGSCSFIRLNVLKKLGGWDEDSIAEDVELAIRIVKNGFKIKYAPDVQSWQENPSSLMQLIKQRTRWFRGYMETFIKHNGLLNFSKTRIDAGITLAGPFILTLIFSTYFISLVNLFIPNLLSNIAIKCVLSITNALTVISLSIMSSFILYHIKPRKAKNIVWIPVIYLYWILQTAIAFYVFIKFIFKRSRTWVKTEKTGSISKIIEKELNSSKF